MNLLGYNSLPLESKAKGKQAYPNYMLGTTIHYNDPGSSCYYSGGNSVSPAKISASLGGSCPYEAVSNIPNRQDGSQSG